MASSPTLGRKLGWLSIFSSGTGLLAASIALLLFQVQEARNNVLGRLETIAELMAFNTTAAVDFNDAETATAMLRALKTRPSVLSAGIVSNGHLFAVYRRKGVRALSRDDLLATTAGHRFLNDQLSVYRPITSEAGRRLGMLFIHVDLRNVQRASWRVAVTTTLIAIPALLMALGIAQLLQRSISRPLLNLASLAAGISRDKDYSVRAPEGRSVAEVDQLVGTFNEMLSEIEESRAMLEHRVADRTRQLEIANRELEAFSYSVSHDLRAPLRAIDGFSKALLSDYHDRLDKRGIHFLERVRAGTLKMSQLIDDLLHLSKVTRKPLQRTTVDITAIAGDVAAELARRHPEREVDVVIEPELSGSADAHLLTIVFENLLGNAWKFTGRRSDARIEVGRTAMDGDEPAFFVRDNGAGFDAAYADKLFGAFQRLHNESEFEGTGIGLATVKRIITRHGGIVSAKSVEGAGATFYFTLGGGS